MFIIISEVETNKIFLKEEVKKNDILEYNWIHSFEKIPWNEKFEIISEDKLLLKEIVIEGFGAGIPENKGKLEIDKNKIKMKEINSIFDEIKWINSITALKTITLNGKVLTEGRKLPHHKKIKLEIKQGGMCVRKNTK